MGKRYYCDYCERSFADGAENRKKHLASVNHKKLKKEHYAMFRDAASILEENKTKNPCRKFHTTGTCEFGMNCRFSHLTPADVQRLEQQVILEKSFIASLKRPTEEDLDKWIESKAAKIKEKGSSVLGASQPTLPPVLANIPNLPPSLIPSTVFEFYNAQKRNDQDWG